MPIAALIPLIIQYGIPAAEFIWSKFSSNTPVTQEDWDKLKAMADQNSSIQMGAALTRAGIDPNSDKGKALLALVK